MIVYNRKFHIIRTHFHLYIQIKINISDRKMSGYGHVMGKTLFVLFLIMRGIQHHANPAPWVSNFNEKYATLHKSFSPHEMYQIIPKQVQEHLTPNQVTKGVNVFSRYLGHLELSFALMLFLGIPFLPIVCVLFLTIEAVVLYNPFSGVISKDFYYFILQMAQIGIGLMMCFEPPKRQKHIHQEDDEHEHSHEHSHSEEHSHEREDKSQHKEKKAGKAGGKGESKKNK